MVLTGEMVPAEEALRIGLVDWIVPGEQLEDRTESLISELLKGSSVSKTLAKKLVTDSFDSTFEEALTTYLDYQQISIASEEHKQAMQAYRARMK